MEYKQRMYAMVLRQLNPMQKGIQALHAVVEYAQNYFTADEYQQWAKNDKTMIVLDGGVSTELAEVMKQLDELNYVYTVFKEPDLYDQVTAIAFLVPETVWDKETYPDYETYKTKKLEEINSPSNISYCNTILFKNLVNNVINTNSWAKDVFHYPMDESTLKTIEAMRNLIFSKKLSQ